MSPVDLEEPDGAPRRGVFLLVIFAVAFAFLGSRGLWEPDEGRSVNAAMEMVRGGDWRVPRLHGHVYLDKPPLVYWGVAAGVEMFGANEWAARLANACAFALTALLVAGWAGAEWGRRIGRRAGLAYATTLLPVTAAGVLTPDTLLTLFVTAMSLAYWRHARATTRRARWLWALTLGAAVALALLSKGTAALVFAAPLGIHLLWKRRRAVLQPELWVAAALGVGLGSLWYVSVAGDLAGAASYFFDNQVAGRLWHHEYDRDGEWWKAFEIYGLGLVLGSLPWSLVLFRLFKRSERARWRADGDGFRAFLLLAFGVPLLVLVVAKSKLPFYVLPLLPLLAMAAVRVADDLPVRWWHRRLVGAVVLALALRAVAAVWVSPRDSRQMAETLLEAGVRASDCLDTLESKHHALSFYGFERLSWHVLWGESYPHFEPPLTFEEDLGRLVEECDGNFWVISKRRHQQPVEDFLAAAAVSCERRPLNETRDLLECRAGLR